MAVERRVQVRPLWRRSVRVRGAMSMRQKDWGGALRVWRIAARMTAGWVMAMVWFVCLSSVASAASLANQFSTRVMRAAIDSPLCGVELGSESHWAMDVGSSA